MRDDGRQESSVFSRIDPAIVERAVAALASDLDDGTGERRHADLVGPDDLDLGYRIVIAGR